ncbi:serine/threonine-protein kinase, partial [Nostoc sp. NIES-2111]
MSEAEEIFLDAVDLAPAERERLLTQRCRTDELRREVESLLEHDRGAEAFFHSAISSAARDLDSSQTPTEAGPYRLGTQLGEGGMGAVYRATRPDHPTAPPVAIKLLARHRTRPGLLSRFAREREILASLSHPNIARFLDAGLTADASPYLALEYIDGQAIDLYCQAHKLSPADIVRLFIPVCAAVEYAHSRFIVHRDLKPANIFVTREGQPKLLDFGIAQVLDTDATRTATLALTLEYASPEQLRGERPSPSMDVYSLGAVLHKLLTGAPPHALAQLPLDQAIDVLLS